MGRGIRRDEVRELLVRRGYFTKDCSILGGKLMDTGVDKDFTGVKLRDERVDPETLIYIKTTLCLVEMEAPMLIGPIRAGDAERVRGLLDRIANDDALFGYHRQSGSQITDEIESLLRFPIFDIEDCG